MFDHNVRCNAQIALGKTEGGREDPYQPLPLEPDRNCSQTCPVSATAHTSVNLTRQRAGSSRFWGFEVLLFKTLLRSEGAK